MKNVEGSTIESAREVIEEAMQVLESGAAYNRSKGRTVFAHAQQDRADRLRALLGATPVEAVGGALVAKALAAARAYIEPDLNADLNDVGEERRVRAEAKEVIDIIDATPTESAAAPADLSTLERWDFDCVDRTVDRYADGDYVRFEDVQALLATQQPTTQAEGK